MQVTLAEVPPPEADGRVTVRPETLGICGTDVKIFTGRVPAEYPIVIGHEMVGEGGFGARRLPVPAGRQDPDRPRGLLRRVRPVPPSAAAVVPVRRVDGTRLIGGLRRPGGGAGGSAGGGPGLGDRDGSGVAPGPGDLRPRPAVDRCLPRSGGGRGGPWRGGTADGAVAPAAGSGRRRVHPLIFQDANWLAGSAPR